MWAVAENVGVPHQDQVQDFSFLGELMTVMKGRCNKGCINWISAWVTSWPFQIGEEIALWWGLTGVSFKYSNGQDPNDCLLRCSQRLNTHSVKLFLVTLLEIFSIVTTTKKKTPHSIADALKISLQLTSGPGCIANCCWNSPRIPKTCGFWWVGLLFENFLCLKFLWALRTILWIPINACNPEENDTWPAPNHFHDNRSELVCYTIPFAKAPGEKSGLVFFGFLGGVVSCPSESAPRLAYKPKKKW